MTNVCYIDDNQANLLLVKKGLSKTYNVTTVDSAVDALDTLRDVKPELIILDVNMPEIDGFSLCTQLKDIEGLSDIPVIFLSARKSLEDRLKGYAVGAEAYLSKPFDISELEKIVAALIVRRQQILESKKSADESQAFAFSLMRNNSETGALVAYARKLAESTLKTELCERTIEVLADFGLSSTVALSTTAGTVLARSDGANLSPLEIELFESVGPLDRIVGDGNKFIFHGKKCTFLIRDMPINDEELTGRLRDHLSVMNDLLDASLELVDFREREKNERFETSARLERNVGEEFRKVKTLFGDFNRKIDSTFDELMAEIEESFLFLGLTEEQEVQLSSFIKDARYKLEKSQEISQELNNSIAMIMDQLKTLS